MLIQRIKTGGYRINNADQIKYDDKHIIGGMANKKSGRLTFFRPPIYLFLRIDYSKPRSSQNASH